jgi:hypothetical protein
MASKLDADGQQIIVLLIITISLPQDILVPGEAGQKSIL